MSQQIRNSVLRQQAEVPILEAKKQKSYTTYGTINREKQKIYEYCKQKIA